MGDGADVILVRMGDHHADQIFFTLNDIGGVGQDDVDAGANAVAEPHAAIDHQPFAVIAVEVEVGAELAGAAERDEGQLAAHDAAAS